MSTDQELDSSVDTKFLLEMPAQLGLVQRFDLAQHNTTLGTWP